MLYDFQHKEVLHRGTGAAGHENKEGSDMNPETSLEAIYLHFYNFRFYMYKTIYLLMFSILF